MLREVIWHQKTLSKIKSYPEAIKKEIGFLIYRLQKGDLLDMPHSRSFPTVAVGVNELRVKNLDGIYRVFYYLKHRKGILLFHAFAKKTEQTSHHEIIIAKKNLREILNEEK